jgi:hypothetical protein
MCGRFAISDETAVSRLLKIARWNWHWPESRDMASETAPPPSLPKIPLQKIPHSVDHERHANPHAAARGQIPSPKPPQAQTEQKVKTLQLL